MKKYKLWKLFLYSNIMLLTLFLLVIFVLIFDKTLIFVTLTDTGHTLDIIWISFCPTLLDFQGKTDTTSYGFYDVLDCEKKNRTNSRKNKFISTISIKHHQLKCNAEHNKNYTFGCFGQQRFYCCSTFLLRAKMLCILLQSA